MNSNKWKKWEEIRSKGRNNYIKKYGIYGFGIPYSIMMSIDSYFTDNEPILWIKLFVIIILFPIIVFASGYIFGLLSWHVIERQYKNYSKKSDDKNT